MENIDEQLNKLSVMEVPLGIHQSIMHKINYNRIKPVLFTAFFLFTINFLLIAWHINSKLIDAEFSDMMHDFFDSFVLSFSFINTIVGSFFEIITPTTVFYLLINLVGIVYLGNKIRSSEYEVSFETKQISTTY